MRNPLTLGVVFCVLFITTIIYAQQQDNWAPTTDNKGSVVNMVQAVELNTQVLLKTGEVLVAGGTDGTNYFPTAQLYNPATGTWSKTGSMATGRAQFAAVVLPSGKVLVEGGIGPGGAPLHDAEIYDPKAGTWSTVNQHMSVARSGHTATLLSTGKVLVTGGCTSNYYCGTATAVSEIFDPSTGAWNTTTSMTTARYGHTATLLHNGTVLVIGGPNLNTMELYDPSAKTWTQLKTTSGAVRYQHTATLLSNGNVLVAGGTNGFIANTLVEIYDPSTGTFLSPPTYLNKPGRYAHTATALPNNTVLLAAGEYIQPCGRNGHCPQNLNTAEIVDYNVSPPKISYTAVNLNTARSFHTATLLRSNDVLVAGGCTAFRYCPSVTNVNNVTAASEIYTPLTLSILPYSIPFPMEKIGVTSATQTVTVTNVSHNPVEFISPITASGDFLQTNTCPKTTQTLAVGASCTINVTFTPSNAGKRTGAVTLHDKSVGSPSQTIALTGVGETLALGFTPASLNLGTVPVGSTSSQSATVTNDSAAKVSIKAISISPADGTFTQTNNCPATLNVQETCTVTIVFTPPDVFTYNQTLLITNSGNGTAQLRLTGTGADGN